MKNIHEKYIQKCFELAERGTGKVSPNPLVGSVILKDDKVIAEGWHTEYGKLHAEAEALKIAGDKAFGATLYCNLEPCCHTNKKTPPCAQAIIKAGIKKVYISNLDPNPQVAGKGVELLREAGVEVKTGILENQGAELNKFFFKFIQVQRPYISLKIAQTIDNKITLIEGEQKWITGTESKKYVHKLRNKYDAVLIGANTVNIDDPELTVRKVEGRNPVRIIVDGKLSSNPDAKIFNDDNTTLLFHSKNITDDKKNIFIKKGIKLFPVAPNQDQNLDLDEIMKILADEKISSVLVEGGAGIFSQFLSKSLFDELIILQGSKIFGVGLDSFKIPEEINLKLKIAEQLGDDLRIIYRKL